MMHQRPDEDGRYPLSMKEYTALRTLFGAVNALDSDTLKERCKLFPGGWRDLRCAYTLCQRLMEKLLCTIPAKKLLSMRRELTHTICEVKIRPLSSSESDSVMLDRKALIDLINRAIYMDCMLCQKTVKECKHCPLFKTIDACFPYDLIDPKDELCPFAGVSRLEEEG